ncbi:MAG: Sir2 family NAD-dependent protein deacetylase [Pseudomonadota bacterium]
MKTLTHAQNLIANSLNIVAFTGAGLSAESGISTFRGSKDSEWSRFDPMRLASQQGFSEDPETVIRWYNDRRRQLSTATPNPAHIALADQGIFTITQNVDNLLERAGCQPEHIVHLHGEINADRCNNSQCDFYEAVTLDKPPPLRRCPQCQSSYCRPSVVWFGEPLPQTAWAIAEQKVLTCDCLLVVGTSATVYPAASLIELAANRNARVIVIDPAPKALEDKADILLTGAAASLLPRLLETKRI